MVIWSYRLLDSSVFFLLFYFCCYRKKCMHAGLSDWNDTWLLKRWIHLYHTSTIILNNVSVGTMCFGIELKIFRILSILSMEIIIIMNNPGSKWTVIFVFAGVFCAKYFMLLTRVENNEIVQPYMYTMFYNRSTFKHVTVVATKDVFFSMKFH